MSPASASSSAPDSPPLLTVSIVSHGHSAELRLLLESLARHEPADRIQILITDNLGRDLPDLERGGWHSLSVIRNTRRAGFAANHNAAFARALGAYLCALNPDVVFLEPALLKLIGRIDGGEGHIAAPVLIDSGGAVQDSYRRLPSPWELVGRRLGHPALPPAPAAGALLHPDWIAGTFMLMRREAFTKLGGFDSRYRLYFEDVDLCTRARLLGFIILVDAGLRLRHDPHRASRRLGKSLLWHVQGALRFFTSDTYRRARLIGSHG